METDVRSHKPPRVNELQNVTVTMRAVRSFTLRVAGQPASIRLSTLPTSTELSADGPVLVPAQSRTAAARRAEAKAWLVVWLAFATFCALALTAAKVATDYVATAEIDLPARVEDYRGLVFVKGAGRAEARLNDGLASVLAGSSIEATRTGSATVRLFDGSRITPHSGGVVDVLRMDVGRFISRRTILLRQQWGPTRYEVQSEAIVEVPNGSVRLSRGDATIWVQENRTSVLVYEGEARLEMDGSSVLVRPGERADLSADRRLTGPLPRAEQLLANGDFSQRAVGWEPIDVPRDGSQDTRGVRRFVEGPIVDGRPTTAMQVVRQSVRNEHGRTGLQQVLNLDVSGYRSLWIEALVRVDSHSLSGGGVVGSEYPMMLLLQYEGPAEGSRPDWSNGFYVANPEGRPVQNAQQVRGGEWVRYRVNLMDPRQMDDEQMRRPFRLLQFAVMAQGHSFDARVADVRIVGD